MGNYSGGRLWIESPLGLDPPPCATEKWQKDLRGDFHDMHNTWTRIPQRALNELQDVGFYPPRVVNHASASQAALEPFSQDQDRSEADKPTIMVSPSSEEEAILQEWCMQDHVGLPYLSPASSNGEVKPLSAEELDELKAHIIFARDASYQRDQEECIDQAGRLTKNSPPS